MDGAITEMNLTGSEANTVCAARFVRGLRKWPLLRH